MMSKRSELKKAKSRKKKIDKETYSYKAVRVEQTEEFRGDGFIVFIEQLHLVPDICLCIIACIMNLVIVPFQFHRLRQRHSRIGVGHKQAQCQSHQWENHHEPWIATHFSFSFIKFSPTRKP